jgi:hypothetical protein
MPYGFVIRAESIGVDWENEIGQSAAVNCENKNKETE